MVLSGWLKICERESVKKSERAFSCWLVFLTARKWREEYVLCHVGWLVQLLASGEVRREQEMFSTAFYVAPGEVTRAEWHQSFSLGEIYKFELQWPKRFMHKIIIWNSFCYSKNLNDEDVFSQPRCNLQDLGNHKSCNEANFGTLVHLFLVKPICLF